MKDCTPIIRESKIHMTSKGVENFISDSIGARYSAIKMLKAYRKILLIILTEYLDRIHTGKQVKLEEYKLVRETASKFFYKFLDALDLSRETKEAVVIIDNDFDSLFEQCVKFQKAEDK